MKHPDRVTWYVAAVFAVVLALALAAGVFFLTVALPSFIWGDSALIVWPYVGIPLGGLLGLLSLVSLRFLPDLLYGLLGGDSV